MSPPTAQLALPPDYPRIRVVSSLDELLATPFANGINALCWQRKLEGDFAEVARCLACGPGIHNLDPDALAALSLSPAGRIAADAMLADYHQLEARDLEPVLDYIDGYLHPDPIGPVSTDVRSFHVDSATAEADTYLCTYYGPSSQGLRNDQAQRHIDDPATRAALLAYFGGPDGPEFIDYLSEHSYDLHYSPSADAQPFDFGIHNLWRIATEYPGSPVPPCIHRAPDTGPSGGQVRLLLIA